MRDLFAVPDDDIEFAESCKDAELDDIVAVLVGKKPNKRDAILRLATIAATILLAENAPSERFTAIVEKAMAIQKQYRDTGRLRRVPRVILEPAMQAEVDADPAKQAALAAAKEKILTALQGVKDGTYKSFDDAMFALTGHRPTLLTPEEAAGLLDNDPSHHTKQ